MQKRNGPFARGLLLFCVSMLLAGCGSSSGRHLGSGLPPGGSGGTPLPPPSGGGFPPPPPLPDPSPGQIVVSGIVTFDRVPFAAAAGGGLDFAAVNDTAPVRGATVEAINEADGAVLATTTSSDTGAFAFALPASLNVHIRVKAELVRTGTPAWDFRVLDNTDGNALYALDGPAFNTGTAATLDIGDLHAASGWDSGSNSYPNDGARSAAPFAILDTVYNNLGLVLGTDASTVLPPLELFWSPANTPNPGTGDPDTDLPAGDIGTTFYLASDGTVGSLPAIYILGAQDDDTDEFDSHVLAHEWGHYFQDNFARDDSLGGDHALDSLLDLTVAFSEGWGDTFSAMASGDPLYRDSFNTAQAMDFAFDLESQPAPATPGWFSESSIGSLLYDFYDGAGADAEPVQVSFASLWSALDTMADTDAFTGIHPFVRALTAIEPTQQAGIEALLAAQNIEPQPSDDFAPNETNDGGDAQNLPVYRPIAVNGGAQRLCTTGSPAAFYDALGNRRYLRLDIVGLAQTVTISVTRSAPNAALDPDVFIYAQGDELAGNDDPGPTSTISALTLQAGTYVIEAYDFAWIGDPPAPAGTGCFNISVTSP